MAKADGLRSRACSTSTQATRFFLPPTQTAYQHERIVPEHSSRGQGKRDGRMFKNHLSYNLVMSIVIIVVIHCASGRGGKHAEHLTSFRVVFAPWGGMSDEHLLVDVSSGNNGSTGYYECVHTGAWHGTCWTLAQAFDAGGGGEDVVGTLVASPCRARWGVSRVTRRSPYIIQTILTTNQTPLYFFFFSFSLQL